MVAALKSVGVEPERTPASPDAASSADEVAQRFSAVFSEARGFAAQLQRLVEIEVDRARLKVGSWASRAVLIGMAAAVGLAALPLGVWYLLSGIVGAVSAAAGGREWVGRLVVGGLVLGGAGFGLALAARRRDLAELRRLEQKYDAVERKPS